MKKIIAALFAVAFAYGAQAAATDWAFYGYYEDVNGNPLEGSISVYLDDTLLSTMDIVGGVAEDTISVDAGTLKILADVTNFSDGEGTLEWQYVISSIPLPGYPDADTTMQFLQASVEAAVTADYSLDLDAGVAANGYTPAGPTPPVIPEPTTGLLVLIGIAGLALKRKVA